MELANYILTFVHIKSSNNILADALSGLKLLDICHRHGKGIRKETKRFGAFIEFRVLTWMLADAQMNPGSSDAHAQWFSCRKIRADDHDVLI